MPPVGLLGSLRLRLAGDQLDISPGPDQLDPQLALGFAGRGGFGGLLRLLGPEPGGLHGGVGGLVGVVHQGRHDLLAGGAFAPFQVLHHRRAFERQLPAPGVILNRLHHQLEVPAGRSHDRLVLVPASDQLAGASGFERHGLGPLGRLVDGHVIRPHLVGGPFLGVFPGHQGVAVALEVGVVGGFGRPALVDQLLAVAGEAPGLGLEPDGVAGGLGPLEREVGDRPSVLAGDGLVRAFGGHEGQVQPVAVDLFGVLGVALANPHVGEEGGVGRVLALGPGRRRRGHLDQQVVVADDLSGSGLLGFSGLAGRLRRASRDHAGAAHVLHADLDMAQQADRAGALVAHRPASGLARRLLAPKLDLHARGGRGQRVPVADDDRRVAGDRVGILVVFQVRQRPDREVVAQVRGGPLVVPDHHVAFDGGVDHAGLIPSAHQVGRRAELDVGLLAGDRRDRPAVLAPPDQCERLQDQELAVVLAHVIIRVNVISAVRVVIEVVGPGGPVGGAEGVLRQRPGVLLGAGLDVPVTISRARGGEGTRPSIRANPCAYARYPTDRQVKVIALRISFFNTGIRPLECRTGLGPLKDYLVTCIGASCRVGAAKRNPPIRLGIEDGGLRFAAPTLRF